MVAEYCQEMGLPSDASTFVMRLRGQLTQVAEQVDAAFPGNKSVEITAKGEPVLKRIVGKAVPASRIGLQEALRKLLQIALSWISSVIQIRRMTGHAILDSLLVLIRN
jgi:hypothetical protein